MDKFLDRDNLPRLYQEGTHNLNRLIASSETEFLINKTPRKQKSNTRCITCEFYQTFKRVNTCFSQTIPKTRRGRNASKFLLVANITRYQYRQRHHLKKKKNCRSVSLVIIDTQILNKILANWIQPYIKRIINHETWSVGLYTRHERMVQILQ